MRTAKYIPSPVKTLIRRILDCLTWDRWHNRSWSQEGEDMVLRRIFEKQTTGFYVDVGAHHPKRFSNTYFFYRRGWTGINIDAMPGSMRSFQKSRPKDINIEIGISKERGELDYYVFNEPALNSFSSDLSAEREKANNAYSLKQVIKVEVLPLSEILAQHLGERNIDFLSVDVEGVDLAVLQSNDWSKYRPKFVLAEVLNSSLHDIEADPAAQFMKKNGYVLYAKQVNTIFFKDASIKA